jgi:hypothetical protein
MHLLAASPPSDPDRRGRVERGRRLQCPRSVLVTRTDSRRAVSCDLDTADGALTVVKIEEAYAHAGYATLGEGNVPVFCSRETWKAWREANPGGKVVKSELSGGFVTEITFTGFSSERDGPLIAFRRLRAASGFEIYRRPFPAA